MNEDIDNDKDYQIMELKQRISYYEPYKQKYEDLKEDWKYIKSLLDKEFNERTRLKKENEQLKEEYKIAVDEMVTDYKKLEKENEQLQKELQRFKKYVFSQDNILCYKCEHCIKKDIYVVDCEMKGKVDVHGLCSLFREVKV